MRCQLQKSSVGRGSSSRRPPNQHCLSPCLLLASPSGAGRVGNSVAVAFQGAGSEDFLKPIKQGAPGGRQGKPVLFSKLKESSSGCASLHH